MGEMLPVFILLVIFSFIALMVKFDYDFKLKREKIRAEGGGRSLGTSELRGLIQEAMHDANAPLEERLDLIEAHMRRLPEHDAETSGSEAIHPDEPIED